MNAHTKVNTLIELVDDVGHFSGRLPDKVGDLVGKLLMNDETWAEFMSRSLRPVDEVERAA